MNILNPVEVAFDAAYKASPESINRLFFRITEAGVVKPAQFPPGYIGRAERRRRERIARKQKGQA